MNRSRQAEMLLVAQSLIAAGEGLARLAEREGSSETDWFSTENLPPGVSRRTFREVARRIDGHIRDGHHLRVRRDDWLRARAAARKAPLAEANDIYAESIAKRALALNGLQLVPSADKNKRGDSR